MRNKRNRFCVGADVVGDHLSERMTCGGGGSGKGMQATEDGDGGVCGG